MAANYLGPIEGAAEVASGTRSDLTGVKAIDSMAVSIRLVRPSGYFLGMLAYPTGWVVCKEAIEKNAGRLDENAAIGTGPFRFGEYHHGGKFTLVANPDYYGGRPPLDRIERPIVKDPQTAHIMFERGELDLTGVTPGDYLRDKKDPALANQLRLMPAAVTLFIVMHPRLQPVFKDIRVRRAIAEAIDRDEIVRVASQGVWARADSFIPPGFPGFNPRFRRIPLDPADARRLLAEAGFPGGRGLPKLILIYSQSSPELTALAQIVRDNLKQNLGITIDLQERESATLRTDAFDQKIPFCLQDWGPDYIDPQNFLSTLLRTDAKLNFSGYSNPKFDGLCDRADVESDMSKRIPLYQRADQLAMDEVAVLPLYYGNARILVKPYVKDWERNLMSFLPHYHTRAER